MKRVLKGLLLVLLIFVLAVYISTSSTNKKFDTCTVLDIGDVDSIDFKKHQYVKVAASTLYNSNALKNLMQGENYRLAWETPVEVAIVYLDTLLGGMTILHEGGGMQTESLKLRSADEHIYTLRSVNKNPQPLVPEIARTLKLENIIVDGISAQNPYAAPVVAELSDNVGLLHTMPKLFFVPKQKALGSYNTKYGNRLFYLEHEINDEQNWTRLNNIVEIVDTEDLQKLKMKYGDRVSIDKELLIRARLFDMLIGDWDRHAKQWGWAIQSKDSSFVGIPIATDRDNAFFSIDGVLPAIMTNKNVIEILRPFEETISYMEGLVYDFDVYFLQNVDSTVYINQAKYLQKHLTDEVIDKALHYWNETIYNAYSDQIKRKIKARRKNLIDISLRFKSSLEKRPLLDKPLKGSDREDVDDKHLKCFDCQ